MSNIEARKSGSPTNSGHQQLSAPSATLQQFSNFLPHSNAMTALDHYRLSQLYQYALAADRLRGPLPNSTAGTGASPATAFQHSAITAFRPEMAAAAAAAVPLLYNNPYYRLDPRLALYRPPEEPKPQHSYIGLIAMAILSSVDKKLVLSDIYQYILDNYAYFRTRGPGWRNSIRHNLSLNDCFVKAGRSANGKGHYWAIHPANIDDFQKGDFRRRKAQRKVRRHMGLAVDDEDSPSPPPNSPPPLSMLRHPPDVLTWQEHPNFIRHSLTQHLGLGNIGLGHLAPQNMSVSDTPLYTGNIPVGFNKYITSNSSISDFPTSRSIAEQVSRNTGAAASSVNKASGRHKKRQFDVASLLAPENIKEALQQQTSPSSSGNGEHAEFENNDHCSVSPAEKMYENKTRCSSSSSSFQVQSDDDEEEQRDEECKAASGNSSKTPERERSQSPSANIAMDNDDLSPVNAFGMSAPRSGHVHARRLSQRRHFRSRRLTRIGDNNNKEQSATNCLNSRRIVSLNENNARGFNSNNELLFPAGQGQSQESNIDRSHPNTNELFFQQNPSLASLMILSSRYRELTSSMQLQQQITTKRP